MASFSEELMKLFEQIHKDINEIKRSIDETFKENEDVCESHVREVVKDESNHINQDSKQNNDTNYHSDEENSNKIFDKDENDLDQDCDESQANNVVKYLTKDICIKIKEEKIKEPMIETKEKDNIDDQCINKNVTITNALRTYVITRTAMKNINENNYKINQTQDKIGVFVSIISTKVPSKGTST